MVGYLRNVNMTYNPAVKLIDESGIPYGVKHVENKIRVSAMPYLYDIAEGNVANHQIFHVIGYNGDVDLAVEDLWYNDGTYVPPSAAMGLEVVSSSEDDAGVIIKSGTSDSITQEVSEDEYTLTLTDAAVDFTAATAVIAGDIVLFDGDGIYGEVLTVAANVLTVLTYSDEFATSAQNYRVVDNSASGTGCHVIGVDYLDADYLQGEEFVVLNGTSVVPTVSTNILRVNGLHTIHDGTGNSAAGKIDIRHIDDTPIYRSIPAGFNNDMDALWTVPAAHKGYITQWQIASGHSQANKQSEAWLRCTSDHHGHYARHVFHMKDVSLVQDNLALIQFTAPIFVPPRTDIKISVKCVDTNAIMAGHFEGWYEHI